MLLHSIRLSRQPEAVHKGFDIAEQMEVNLVPVVKG
jgi:hypothetical protein